MTQSPRPIEPGDISALARLWHRGWHWAHAALVPADLVALRSLQDFRRRLLAMGPLTRCVGVANNPQGFCAINGNEIDQLFVSSEARGTGLAARLLQNGEERLKASGVATAQLDCVAQNKRAVAFYTKHGWQNHGLALVQLHTSSGPYSLETLVFRKTL